MDAFWSLYDGTVNHHDTNHLNQTNVTSFKLDSNEQFPAGNAERQLINSSTESNNPNRERKIDKELFSKLKRKLTVVFSQR